MKQLCHFNKSNRELTEIALGGFEQIPRRYFQSIRFEWWAYTIAEKFNVSPIVVKTWDSEEIIKALAYIELTKPKR